jgi:trehalose 6-phosphate phosphatase
VLGSVSAFLNYYAQHAWLVPKRLVVATDFDGCLAPIELDPAAVRPLPEAIDALRRLVTSILKVAVISGRSNSELSRLVPVGGVELLGDYGLDEPTPDELAALSALAAEADAVVSAAPGAWVERKAGSLTIHFRQAPRLGSWLLAELAPRAGRRGLRARQGRMVVEVMPARADKGTALRRLIEREGPGAAIYCGDDTGDLTCFEYLAGLELPHLAVGVRSPEVEPELFRLCDLVLDGPSSWAGALGKVAEWAEAAGPAGP